MILNLPVKTFVFDCEALYPAVFELKFHEIPVKGPVFPTSVKGVGLPVVQFPFKICAVLHIQAAIFDLNTGVADKIITEGAAVRFEGQVGLQICLAGFHFLPGRFFFLLAGITA